MSVQTGSPRVRTRSVAGSTGGGQSGRRVQRLAERRRHAWQAVVVGAAVFFVGSAIALTIRSRHHEPRAATTVSVQQTVVWSVRQGDRAFVAVVAGLGGRAPTVMAIPGDTLVDLPGGGPQDVGAAGRTPGRLMAAIQAALNRRIDHYLVSDGAAVGGLIDRLGGARTQVERAFSFQGRAVGPGPVRLSGDQAVAYLAAGTKLDRTGRWEDVLAGLFAARDHPKAFSGGALGTSDEEGQVARVLAGAHGAPVLELPTTPSVGGGVVPDAKAVAALLRTRLAAAASSLVRVVVLNGNGLPGMGMRVASILSPEGYRVVASQNGRSFGVRETKIVASHSAFLGQAERVKNLLGVGKVYVGTIPSGSADVTILVGKDFN